MNGYIVRQYPKFRLSTFQIDLKLRQNSIKSTWLTKENNSKILEKRDWLRLRTLITCFST